MPHFSLLVIFFVLFWLGCHDEALKNDPSKLKKIRMASFPTEDIREQLSNMKPLKKYLGEKIGIPVEIIITSDYFGVIEALRSKHVEIAWLGPFSYILASKICDVEPMVGGIRESTGKSTYNSIIITRTDTNIETIDDLKGHSFAFLDPSSTSGYLMPMNMFKKRGIEPGDFFSNYIFAGSHAAVQIAVASGQVDAGADSMPSYNLMVKRGYVDPEKIKILWVSEDIPPSPIVVRSDLNQELKGQIKGAFLDLRAAQIIHAEGKIKGYIEVKDSDYNVLRKAAVNLNLDLYKHK
jgi:phosphonate transport system substrate-binding protein